MILLELLDKKDKNKLLMLYLLQNECVETANSKWFKEALEKHPSLALSEKSLRSFDRYIEEIATDIQNYDLYDKISIKLSGKCLVINREIPFQPSFLLEKYLHHSVKFLLLFQGAKRHHLSASNVLEWINSCLPYGNISLSTLYNKVKELNEVLSSNNLSLNSDFLLSGEEGNLRIYLYKIFYNVSLDFLLSLESSEDAMFSCAMRIFSKRMIDGLRPVFTTLSSGEEKALELFATICFYRIRNHCHLNKNRLYAYLKEEKDFSPSMNFFYEKIAAAIKANNIKEDIELEARFAMNFCYIFHFSVKQEELWFNSSFLCTLEELWKKQLDEFLVAEQETPAWQMLKEDVYKIYARFLQFGPQHKIENYMMEELEGEEYFLYHYPVANQFLSSFLTKLSSVKEEEEKEMPFALNQQLFYPMVYLFYHNMKGKEILAFKQSPVVKVCVDMPNTPHKKEFIQSFLENRYNLNISWQDVTDKSTDFLITNTPQTAGERTIICEWSYHISEEMYNCLANAIRLLQNKRIKDCLEKL
ncbi:Mga helix-turn-helix domain-containing protein [Pilibacter termitis]|uniref:Mga helix-turn-helix domain-containing protein n=1 Tax=Pilibacter termitis TaxID=263852 RepID=A0A1T4MHH9_9ENTE|nr:helix-turn-helix domain-containing protein [Pilibacter termitis]SJZ66228.1 Mga helix-turn-helix domain-containing protein [Pilibacter termitis]